eukprot:TRINITY_DN8820_c0_g1_i5.p1 TRINITY_DN8820_c0_g1~~TRINITY_DN8820_c0_g1_i5.p1  ORF type:complete len:543 (-),score=133.95 TRINITY_DN8820_c0_g1_i5:33-1661(-)
MLRLFALAVLAAVVAHAYAQDTPPVPQFPDVYTVSGIFSIPYFNISEPVTCWTNVTGGQQRIDYYNGMDSYIYRFDLDRLWVTTPVVDRKKCATLPTDGLAPLSMFPPTPASAWSYEGQSKVNGVLCNAWKNVTTVLGYDNTYTLYAAAEDARPVRLEMLGYDFVFGSHPDLYVLDYLLYEPRNVNGAVFVQPSICPDNYTFNPSGGPSRHRRAAMLNRLTQRESSDLDRFRAFATHFTKEYGSSLEVLERFGNWRDAVDLIHLHNTYTASTYSLGMNHFGDWSHDEFISVMLPRKGVPEKNTATLSHDVSGQDLPSSVDWRDKGAVTMVKDQGACGSCWTFGTTGSLEGMYQIKTGRLVSLSEQQIVDCAWGYDFGQGPNMGCGGGFASGAFQWIIDNGGIATESSYPYLMQNAWCKDAIKDSRVRVRTYVNVTQGSEQALTDAVASAGPTAVAIDASHPSFRFYQSGVYYEPACKNGLDDLDHEVLAVGYGTEGGQDYFLVKNSWSTYWGDQGYIKMSRNRSNNCGIATQATYPKVAFRS